MMAVAAASASPNGTRNPVTPWVDRVVVSDHIGEDDRDPGPHGLERHVRSAFVARQQHEDVELRHDRRGVGNMADLVEPARQSPDRDGAVDARSGGARAR